MIIHRCIRCHTDTGGTVPAVPPGPGEPWPGDHQCVLCAGPTDGATTSGGDPLCAECVDDMNTYEISDAQRRIDDVTVRGGRL